MNIVTYETAQRLKAAGFPQPVVKEGQHWYKSDDVLLYVYRVGYKPENENQLLCSCVMPVDLHTPVEGVVFNEHDSFAPDATDILRQLNAHRFSINFVSGVDGNSGEDYEFFALFENGDMQSSHTSPAEAAARTYLSIYEKQPTK